MGGNIAGKEKTRGRGGDESGGGAGGQVRDHFRKLSEKYTGKTFHATWYTEGGQVMSDGEYWGAMEWLNEHFVLLRCDASRHARRNELERRAREADERKSSDII